jgi:hypothetical protein
MYSRTVRIPAVVFLVIRKEVLSVLLNDCVNYWCIASVVDNLMITEHHCNGTDRGKPTSSEK